MNTTAPIIRSEVNHGPQLHVLGGRFEFGDTAIPFFTAHMTVGDIADYLKTPSELAAWTEEGTNLEALYQRSIDYARVRESILPYLTKRGLGKPRFFNALTIALVPSYEKRIVEFADREFDAPGLPKPTAAQHRLDVGPISFGFYKPFNAADLNSFSIGEICWNRDQTACVAIDGQHRLKALKMFHFLKPEAASASRIAVIFLVPDAALGFKVGASEPVPISKVLRGIFIDLNRHAKPVKRSRLILLDDEDPQSLIVRRLVAQTLAGVDELPPVNAEHRLPLPLIDWHSNEAKFDEGPYLSSILMLDRAVQTLLDCRSVTDWSKFRSVENQHRAFQSFGYEPTVECTERLSDLKEAEEAWQKPFTYGQEDRNRIVQSVGAELARPIFRLLTEVTVYQKVLEVREQNGMLSADFSSWYEKYSSLDDTQEALGDLTSVEDHLRSLESPPNIEVWRDVLEGEFSQRKADSLLFKVVFLDAAFRTLQQLWRLDPLVVAEGNDPEKGTAAFRDFWTDVLIGSINALTESEAYIWGLRFRFEDDDGGAVSLWRGSVLKMSDETVDFTNSAMIRASNVLLLAALLFHCKQRLPADEWPVEDFDSLKELLEDRDDQFQAVLENVEQKLCMGAAGNPGPFRRIVIERSPDLEEEDEDEFEEQVKKEFDLRANFYLSLLE